MGLFPPTNAPEEMIASFPRERLVRFCARQTGDQEAADDLAQEALLLAHRWAARLRDPARRDAWILGIARHLCLDWIRARRRERAARADDASWPEDETSTAERLTDVADVEAEAERGELVRLVRRALALLPPEARRVLVARYVEERSLAEIARGDGTSETAIAMRLHRGKLALRRVLATRLRPEAAAYGLAAAEEWRETRVWCPWCGRRYLLCRDDGRVYQVRCPDCDAPPDVYTANLDRREHGAVLQGVRGVKPALSRLLAWTHRTTRSVFDAGPGPCPRCGRPTTLDLAMPTDGPPSLRAIPGVTHRCPACGVLSANGLGILALALPETRQFWRAHPRIRRPWTQEIEVDNLPAIVTHFASVTDGAALDVVSARATYRVLGIHQVGR